MRKTLILISLLLPSIVYCQHKDADSYQQRMDDCKQAIEEKRNAYPDRLVLMNPDCLVGARIPVFTVTTLDGQSVTPDYFKGKITILNFWQISCPPCIAEIPGMNRVIDKFGRDKVNYIAIGPDDEADIQDFLKKHPWQFTQLASGTSLIFDVFSMGWGFPTTYVINAESVIIAAFSGGNPDPAIAVDAIDETLSTILTTALK